VANAAKILAKMRANPRDWRIDDLKVVAAKHGFSYRQQGSSHVVFRHPTAGILTVPAARPIKPIYIRLFVALVTQLEGEA
jgi:predicted RNA binding protein YcfA (HicA-like mRNA interferase family)